MGSQFPLENVADFGLIDFLDEANFEQYIDLIRGENEDPIANFMTQSYDYGQQICGCLPENQFGPPTPVELFDFDVPTNPNQDCMIDSFPKEAIKVVEEEEEENDDESSATTTTTTTPTKKKMKVDRSRTLISERNRRGRMKEKLYALRALVPNITKMDKASIIADAVEYLQDLQIRAKKLKAEVATLESSSVAQGGTFETTNKTTATNFYPITKTILRMDVFQVEERGYYVRVVSKKVQGVAVSLFKALESLISFNVQSSNLATSIDNFVFTFTLHVRDNEVDMNLPNLKMWIASAFLNQGFDFGTSPPVQCYLTSPYHGT